MLDEEVVVDAVCHACGGVYDLDRVTADLECWDFSDVECPYCGAPQELSLALEPTFNERLEEGFAMMEAAYADD